VVAALAEVERHQQRERRIRQLRVEAHDGVVEDEDRDRAEARPQHHDVHEHEPQHEAVGAERQRQRGERQHQVVVWIAVWWP
jgi:hypothetical protein